MGQDLVCHLIHVNGIVQGVGFRPFVFQLATRLNIKGEVSNTAQGVRIVAEASKEKLRAFLQDLESKAPPLARIVELTTEKHPLNGYPDFRIASSRAGSLRSTLISPDVCVCRDCLEEMHNPDDRRYRYPFINCTNCGPRYTIIKDVPYDRPKTSMAKFTMCPLCQAEYDDPLDRRFHAQPNACPQCGPRVELLDSRQQKVGHGDPVEAAASLIADGRIVAVKGLGGFHLAVDATNDQAVARLRRRKKREEKPFAVMAANLEQVSVFASFTDREAELLRGLERPIVLLERKTPSPIAYEVAPRNRYLGVMLPYTPLHYLLLDSENFPALVMTSANISQEPICIANEEAFRRLEGIADFFLVHDREIYLRCDDSVLRRCAGQTAFLRRSRGFVPVPVFLKNELPQVLACGAEVKNTVCLTKGSQAFLSQHIGDLENLAAENHFRKTIDHLKRILDIDPCCLACDLHPDYLSTAYALEEKTLPVIQVQHHHAHIAACLGENKAEGPVIGLAFDGSGYGTDGAVWGGEVLVADYEGFIRAAHLEYLPLPGSAAAIRQPWRMALAVLLHVFGHQALELDLPLFRQLDRSRIEVVAEMIDKGINSPRTSSMGRLFDAAAAMIGLRQEVAFEGQAAMELEMITEDRDYGCYPFKWNRSDEGPWIIEVGPAFKGLVADISQKVPAFIIGARFHATWVELFTKLCLELGEKYRLDQVVLSGGCFQNCILTRGLTAALGKAGFRVLTHRLVPANDGGLSLGQALVAARRLSLRKTSTGQ